MRPFFVILLLSSAILSHGGNDSLQWIKKTNTAFDLFYSEDDKKLIKHLELDIEKGIEEIKTFFQKVVFKKIDAYIFPNRTLLNAQWRKDWNMPDFNSECWMVASGVAHRLDILSTLCWSKEACEHNGNDRIEIQQIITHELTHAFHAQQNPNPTFDGMDDLSGLIEGLATYVSGQLTDAKIRSVKETIVSGKAPEKLADFWKGKIRYQQAGSLIKFIDEKYGREKLYELLKLTILDEMLNTLHITEKNLVSGWKDYYK